LNKSEVKLNETNETELPAGSDIWNTSTRWTKVSQWHPKGVISNLDEYNKEPVWNEVSYVSVYMVFVCSALAYPVVVVGIMFFLAAIVSLCLTARKPDGTPSQRPADSEVPPGEAAAPSSSNRLDNLDTHETVMKVSSLSARSQTIYALWIQLCCAVPSIMVFGMPMALWFLSRPYPQEVLIALTMVSSAFIVHNGIYMVTFASKGILDMSRADQVDFAALAPQSDEPQVSHWVILPQFQEDVEVVSMTMRSIAQCTDSDKCVGIILAMEAREQGAEEKVKELRDKYGSEFKEIMATYHPSGLPNDPPGKASNLAWAFKQLMGEMKSEQEISQVVVTVADADTDFSAGYFESLARSFLQASPQERYLRIWQAPVLHMKNYNRMPQPIIVGTMLTAFGELSSLCDPHAVRLPYSSYSISMSLARQVGGWDPEWISEDYHMGIKCFLLTYGETSVEPIMLPLLNYVPEEVGQTWGTCMARWSQAKRHALGFSDTTYVFTMLPLVCSSCLRMQRNAEFKFSNCLNLMSRSVLMVVKLANCHVVVGVLSTYAVTQVLLKAIMRSFFDKDRDVDFLLLNMGKTPAILLGTTWICTAVEGVAFVVLYKILEHRVEGTPVCKNVGLHALRNALAMFIWAPLYCVMLGFAIWKAAFSILTQKTFDYEVAPKPVPIGVGTTESITVKDPEMSVKVPENQEAQTK